MQQINNIGDLVGVVPENSTVMGNLIRVANVIGPVPENRTVIDLIEEVKTDAAAGGGNNSVNMTAYSTTAQIENDYYKKTYIDSEFVDWGLIVNALSDSIKEVKDHPYIAAILATPDGPDPGLNITEFIMFNQTTGTGYNNATNNLNTAPTD